MKILASELQSSQDLVRLGFENGSLSAELLNRYRNVEDVGNSFFGAYISGGWSGDSSEHRKKLADHLEAVEKNTDYSGVKEWARVAVADLRRMAERDRHREEEEKVRGR